MSLYHTTGTLRYDLGYRLVAEVDQQIVDYYRSLVPKYRAIQPQKFAAHVSVVRHEIPLRAWGKHEGIEVDLIYDSDIKCGRVYYWLNVFSARLEEVRVELGLSVTSEYTRPPDSSRCFHCTIGNRKNSLRDVLC